MPTPREADQILCDTFSTETFTVDAYVDGDKDNLIIDFWFANIFHFKSNDGILVAMINTTKWKKCLLHIPNVTRVLRDGSATVVNKTGVIDVSDWNDPVAEALHDVDILPAYDGKLYFGALVYSYGLYVETSNSGSRINVAGFSQNPKLRRLWSTMLETIYTFAEIYNDEQIIQYLDIHRQYSIYQLEKQHEKDT